MFIYQTHWSCKKRWSKLNEIHIVTVLILNKVNINKEFHQWYSTVSVYIMQCNRLIRAFRSDHVITQESYIRELGSALQTFRAKNSTSTVPLKSGLKPFDWFQHKRPFFYPISLTYILASRWQQRSNTPKLSSNTFHKENPTECSFRKTALGFSLESFPNQILSSYTFFFFLTSQKQYCQHTLQLLPMEMCRYLSCSEYGLIQSWNYESINRLVVRQKTDCQLF